MVVPFALTGLLSVPVEEEEVVGWVVEEVIILVRTLF